MSQGKQMRCQRTGGTKTQYKPNEKKKSLEKQTKKRQGFLKRVSLNLLFAPGPGPGPGPLRTLWQVLCARIKIARSRSRSPSYRVPGTMCSYSDYQVPVPAPVPVPVPFVPCARYYLLVLRLPGPLRTVYQVVCARIQITRSWSRSRPPSYRVAGTMCSYSDYQVPVPVPVPAPFVPCTRYYALVLRLPGPGPGPLCTAYQVLRYNMKWEILLLSSDIGTLYPLYCPRHHLKPFGSVLCRNIHFTLIPSDFTQKTGLRS